MAGDGETQKYIPALAWYRPFEPFAYALIRICTGLVIIPHGIDRLLHGGPQGELGGFLATFSPTAVGAFEVVGGTLLALGLFTRPIALLLAIEWAGIAVTAAMALKPGTSWLMLGASPHFPAFVAGVCFLLGLRGGGRYSFDRQMPTEI